jgi:hypothetical protein
MAAGLSATAASSERERTCIFDRSQMMHVVSMDEVPMMFTSCSFQSNDVSGAQNSVFLFCDSSRARAHREPEGMARYASSSMCMAKSRQQRQSHARHRCMHIPIATRRGDAPRGVRSGCGRDCG